MMNLVTMDGNVSIKAAITATILSALFLLKFLKKKLAKDKASPPFDGIPVASGSHWLFGHLIRLNSDGFIEGYKSCFVNNADPKTGMCSFWFFNRPTVSVLLGKDVKAVLNTSSHREPMTLLSAHGDMFLGPKALVTLMGKDWKMYRKAVHKSFTPGALKQSQESINFVGETLAHSLASAIKDTSLERSVLPLMKMATIDVFGLAALGVDFKCCPNLKLSPIAEAFEFLTQEYTRRVSNPLNPADFFYSVPTIKNRLHAKNRNLIRSFIAEQIDKARNCKDPSEKNDLLTNILKASLDQEKGQFTDSSISDILMTLLFGGYDTTSITLSYALYLLATHPDIEEQCLSEVNSALGTGDTGSFEGPDKLPYTRAVILETLRLFPPAPVTTRTLEKPLQLHDVCLEKGTNIFTPIWSIQRDARNYPQPESFRPDRWVKKREAKDNAAKWEERLGDDDTGSSDIPPANRDAFCVFAAGGRNCVGRVLALQEAVTLLAFLIRKIKFEVPDGYKPAPKLCSFVQQPEDGLKMILKCR